MSKVQSTVVRDFGGGLNVVDDDLNLSSNFQTILDNVHRGVDNTLSVRWGTELFFDLKSGTTATSSFTGTAAWTVGSRIITFNYPGHNIGNGQHITFTSGWGNMLGLISSEIINKPHGVNVIDANTFRISATHAATVTSSDSGAKPFIWDSHILSGNIVELVYYSDHIVVVDTVGEMARINAAGTATKMWDNSISLSVGPSYPSGWGITGYASSAIFKGMLIICNGQDKPVVMDFSKTPPCGYLGETIPFIGTDNTHVPICKYVTSLNRWVVMAGDPATDMQARIHISATDGIGTYYDPGDVAGSDALYMDLNNTNSSSTYIRGINKFRNLLAVAFDDTITMIELGIMNTVGTASKHEPKINDSVARHGAVSHKSMIFLGFDLVMADNIGVPSFAKSQFDSSIIPTRFSEFIAPMIQQNVSRLTPATLERDIFAVYSSHDSRYILFMPNYDNTDVLLPNNPIYLLASMIGTNRVMMQYPNHGMEEGDLFSLSGVEGSPVVIPSTCKVDTVITENMISFKLEDPDAILIAQNFGGSNVKIKRLRTETTAYALTYNKNLKIKAWSRYRGWNFRAGCASIYGRVFLGSDYRIWRMGNHFDPIYADYRGIFNKTWANTMAFVVGDRARDTVTKEIFTCLVNHTSPGSGTFLQDREARITLWELYKGIPINFAMELPWADFDKRDFTKITKTINVDAKGRDRFTVQMFLDYYYRDKLTGAKTPLLSMDMVGGDEGGHGVAGQTYGTGRMAIRQRQWPFEARGKLFKLRVHGATVEPLSFVAFIFSYKLVGRKR